MNQEKVIYTKKVSIIVPIYNSEQYLSRCIDSLINQTLEDIEIILVNDASPDNSISIMRDYEKRCPELIKIIDSKVNLKQGGARNLGILVAKGEYIGFVDSDDWVKPNMYEILYNKAIANNYDVVGCNYIIKKGSKETKVEQYSVCEWKSSDIKLDIVKKKRLIIESGSVWSKIYKTEMLIDNNILFPENLFYEDNIFCPIVSYYANSFGIVSECLYYYFQDNEMATTKRKNSDHHYDRIKTSEMLREWFLTNDSQGKYSEEVDYLYIKLNYINTINTLLSQYDKINYRKIREVRDDFLSKLPTYYNNSYYIRLYPWYKRFMLRVNDYNLFIYACIYKSLYEIKKWFRRL